jgi:Tfp pilus assembly protein PilF
MTRQLAHEHDRVLGPVATQRDLRLRRVDMTKPRAALAIETEKRELAQRARGFLARRDATGLSQLLHQHVELVTNDSELSYLLATSLMKSQPDQAAPHARRAVEMEPTNAKRLTQVAGVLLHLGHHDEAADLVRRANVTAPPNFEQAPELAYLNGAIADLAHNDDEAEARFREAVAALPEHPVFVRRLAVFLASRGRIGEAIAFLDETLARSPTNEAAKRTKADLQAVQRDAGA